MTPLSPARLALLEQWLRDGGRLMVVFEHHGLPFTGLKLRHAGGHRWEIEPRDVRFGDVTFHDCVRFTDTCMMPNGKLLSKRRCNQQFTRVRACMPFGKIG